MPSEQKMLFFTPELYGRFNSEDNEIALAADAEWEAAIARYHQHLTTLHDKMSSQVIELSKLCLHDGEILQRQEQQHPLNVPSFAPGFPQSLPFWYGVAILAVRLDHELVTLLYFLSDHVSEQPAAADWPFSKTREHWLYDELHWHGNGQGNLAHCILLSSGVVLTIPFGTVLISRCSLSPVSAASSKQSA
jgi:hypothetical protein